MSMNLEVRQRRHQAQAGETQATTQHLTFAMADETYALPVLKVKEIIRYDTLTRVPAAPVGIRGVINLRGCVVSVVDLALLFGLPAAAVTKWTCIVIVEAVIAGEQQTLGLMVDAIRQVVDLRDDEIEPPPAFGTQVKNTYIVGMGRQDKKFIIILDIDRILEADFLGAVTAELASTAELAALPPAPGAEAAAVPESGPVAPAPAPGAPVAAEASPAGSAGPDPRPRKGRGR